MGAARPRGGCTVGGAGNSKRANRPVFAYWDGVGGLSLVSSAARCDLLSACPIPISDG